MKTNKIIATIILMFATLLLLCTNSNAAYQSKPTTSGDTLSQTPDVWIIGIRQLESIGQGMALNEEINTENGLATTDSNNIDVHMLKNTEYGAIVLLGASNYGKQGSGTNRFMNTGTTTGGMNGEATTTGNATGVYELGYSNMDTESGNVEWVAAGGDDFLSNINIDGRYINRYTLDEFSAKVGDATVETKEWHNIDKSAIASDWLTYTNNGFIRGYYKRAFRYFGYYMYASNSFDARASIVSGTGF